ncbi:MAG: hypothetical protein H0U81_00640 [Pyrinomonadaceae bacterium]|nr:hypothetical protein [Pyrinomonadaceae bacterium]
MKSEKSETATPSADELGEQSAYQGPTEMQQQILRGDETKGDPNARDTAGATDPNDTTQEREDRDTTRGNG